MHKCQCTEKKKKKRVLVWILSFCCSTRKTQHTSGIRSINDNEEVTLLDSLCHITKSKNVVYKK